MAMIPKAFLIKTLPATIMSNPSFKNPPTIGIEFDIAYFAAFMLTPSKVAEVKPCVVVKIANTVTDMPIIHFIKPDINSVKAFNLTVLDKSLVIPIIHIQITKGSIIDKKTLIIDLASSPGGVDVSAAKKLSSRVLWASSLPGKYAPESAGELIGECIEGIMAAEVKR